MPKKRKQDDTPQGGWKLPSPLYGLKPLAIATGVDKKGRWIWKKVKQTNKDKKRRRLWEKAADKADKRGGGWMPNPFKKKGKKK